MRTISFITANYVARVLKYNGKEDWSTHDWATVQAASPELFQSVVNDAAAAGFQAIDVWTALCNWQHHKVDMAHAIRDICAKKRMTITSYVGGLIANNAAELDPPFAFMKELGAPFFAGGLWGSDPVKMAPIVNDICAKCGVKWAVENHPEKTPEELLAKTGGGKFENIGVALDTGWCGTQGMDALEAVKRLRDKLFIVHLKDVKAAGAHDTCTLGEGIVPVEKVARYLVETDWQGDIGIEHEPYDRDPMPEVKRSLDRLRQWLK